MAITVETRTKIVELTVGMVGAAPGAAILSELSEGVDAGLSLNNLAIAIANNPAFKVLYPSFLTNTEFATNYLTALLGAEVTATNKQTAIDTMVADLNAGTHRGAAMYKAITTLSATAATDANFGAAKTALANKTEVAVHYSVTTQQSSDSLDTLKSVVGSVTSSAASVTAAKATIDGTGAAGITTSLTTSIDNVKGTGGNDTFIGDNTGTVNTMTAGDSIDGGLGTDTFKVYIPAATAINSLTTPTVTNVENLELHGGALGEGAAAVNSFTSSGYKNILINNPADVTTGATAIISSLPSGLQNLTLKSVNTATGISATVHLAASSEVTLDGFSAGTGGVMTLDIGTSTGASYSIIGSGNSSTFTLANSGALLTKLTLSGDKTLTITESLNALVTIDGSAATGSVRVNATGATIGSTFTFVGGSASDRLTLADNALGLISKGSQLNGGAGSADKLQISDTALSAAELTALNATTGFEQLGLLGALSLDASTTPTFKYFALDANGVHVINNLATGSTIDITASHAANVTASTAVGVNDLKVNIGGSTTSSAVVTVGGVLTIGAINVTLTTLALSSSVNSHVITGLANADNSVYTITGSQGLTITSTSATAIGSKYDASGMTKVVNITGNATAFSAGSSLGDIIIGGSAADTLTASVNSSSLTGNAGADTFNVSVAVAGAGAATAAVTTITDFTKGDIITFGGTAGAFTTTKVDLSGAATLAVALDLLAAGNNTDLKWGQYGGNTYIVDDVDAGAVVAATDTIVKITGLVDLSTSTFAANSVTFA